MNEKKGKKVYVGMSGGVDSSLSAALLKEEGYDVTGVFIQVWQPDFVECTWRDDRRDAMRVASELDIPFITLNLEKEYKQGVIDYMFTEYEKGRTPNPDVMCNREVKFGAFWKWAKEQGADYIATGHYARVQTADSRQQTVGIDNRQQTTESGRNVRYDLLKSKDTNKDQTYFLWTLTQEDLKHVLFPIGHMTKDEVRVEAEKRKLYTAKKKDSQGLCFVGTIDVKEFLKTELGVKKGDVLNEEGEIIGTHDGAMFYTIGERHGFTITKRTTDDTAYYIVQKDLQNNTISVSHTPPETKKGNGVLLESVSFVNDDPKEDEIYEARARYRAPLVKIRMSKVESGLPAMSAHAGQAGKWKVETLEDGLVAVSGQSLVIYKNNQCVGGGIIR